MGADKYEKEKKNRLPPFVPLLIATLDSAAWRALSHGAKALYIELRRQYSRERHNNGRLFLSQRKARVALRSGFEEITRWYRELEHYGFIVKVTPGTLGSEGKGIAPHWRLTELGCNKDVPTKDFIRWDGTPFKDKKKKPATEIHSRVLRNSGAVPLRKSGAPNAPSATEIHSIGNG